LRGGEIELRLDSINGTLLGTLQVTGTGGWNNWKTVSATLSGINQSALSQNRDLYFVFKGRKGPKLFNLDWWEVK
jgi:hypothetical protein